MFVVDSFTNETTPVDIPSAILAGRQLEDTHVCDGQSAAGASERDLDQSEICHEGIRSSQFTVDGRKLITHAQVHNTHIGTAKQSKANGR